jgi:hypothetical protein
MELGAPAAAGPPVLQLQGASQYTPQVYVNTQDLLLQQQQQDIAGASAAAAGTLLQLQLQQRLASRSGVCMLVQCPPPCEPHTLQGANMPVYSAVGGCNVSGNVLGPGVALSGGHSTTAGLLGMPLPSASVIQQPVQQQQQQTWVQPIAPVVTLVPGYGPPPQPSGYVAAVTDGLVLSSSSLLLSEPPGAYSSSSNSSSNCHMAPLHYAAPGAAVCTAPATSSGGCVGGSLGGDFASVAAAMAQEKLAQMQELEAAQERLRQDVITLLPYMGPGPV